MFGRKRQIVEAGCRLCPCQVSLEAGCSDIDIKQTNDTQQAAVHAPARTAQTQGIRHRGASPWQSQSRHRSLPLPTRGARLARVSHVKPTYGMVLARDTQKARAKCTPRAVTSTVATTIGWYVVE